MKNSSESIALDLSDEWKKLTLHAVAEFVTSAVVVDDSPQLRRKDEAGAVEGFFVRVEAIDEGLGVGMDEDLDEHAQEEIGVQCSESSEDTSVDAERENGKDHTIYVQDLTSAFRKSNIPCSFILPEESEDEDEIVKDIVNAANLADILILDWHLKNKSPIVAKKALREIAKLDSQQNGRVRLICIYTGQGAEYLQDIYIEAEKELSDNGLIFTASQPDLQRGRGRHHYLMVLQKQNITDRILPRTLLDAMAELAAGILPSFALAAIAALRKNAHHIASCFTQELDAAYVANRFITDPPEDVDALMRNLIVSEFDSALGLEKVADRFLGRERIAQWIEVYGKPKRYSGYEVKGKDGDYSILIDRFFLSALNSGYVDGIKNKVIFDDGEHCDFAEKDRSKISMALHEGGNITAVQAATMVTERKFARLVSLKREAYGQSKLFSDKKWRPSLTLGTLLRSTAELNGKREYFYCLTPACDTVRLRGKSRGFVFLKLEAVDKDKDKKDLVVLLAGGDEVKLRIDLSPWHVCTYEFIGDESLGRVLAINNDGGSKFTLVTCSGDQLEWLGEVRHDRAMRDMAELNRAWMRLGVLDSEYLRLASRGSAPL